MNLKQLNESLSNLEGTSEILYFEEGLPIVFLFDENHDDENVIQRNIINAGSLIDNADVELVGVESRFGGQFWSEKTRTYGGPPNEIRLYNDQVELANNQNALIATRINMFERWVNQIEGITFTGIDSLNMTNVISDLWNNREINEETMVNHPINIMRSIHFIKTILEVHNDEQINGNIIINCGRDHNIHIENMINNPEIEIISAHRASYVRINTID
jgi:hypothetical protein